MVESIKNLTKNLEVPRSSTNSSPSVGGSNSAVSSPKSGVNSAGVDSVDLSGSIPVATLADFTKKPPIDTEAVSKIKDAIAQGNYPVDLDAVADMLLDAYRDMKS